MNVIALDDSKRNLNLVLPHTNGEISVISPMVVEHSGERCARNNISINHQHGRVELFQQPDSTRRSQGLVFLHVIQMDAKCLTASEMIRDGLRKVMGGYIHILDAGAPQLGNR